MLIARNKYKTFQGVWIWLEVLPCGVLSAVSIEREKMAKKFYDNGPTLSADKSATANMPTKVKMVVYPEGSFGLGGSLNDGLSGVDNQMKKDTPSKIKKTGKI